MTIKSMLVVATKQQVAMAISYLLLLSYIIVVALSADAADNINYKLPNPFKKLTRANVNDYYYIKSTSWSSVHSEQIEEFFSLGLGLTYSVHTEKSGQRKAYAILVDGRQARSYILRNPDATNEQELDCELDHVHSHRRLYPWQYVYNVDEIISSGEGNNSTNGTTTSTSVESATTKKRMAVIYGLGAIWLNLIRAEVRTSLVGKKSPYNILNAWEFAWQKRRVEMMFEKPTNWSDASTNELIAQQRALDQSKLVQIRMQSEFVDRNSRDALRFEYAAIEEFKFGLTRENNVRLQRLQLQLELCKRTNRPRRQFPNLMRALADTRNRTCKILYVTNWYKSHHGDEPPRDGSYSEEQHRFMYPKEIVNEYLSLTDDVQVMLYKGNAYDEHGHRRDTDRTDVFQVRFVENASSTKSAFHAAGYYHLVFDFLNNVTTCVIGEYEPKPRLRLFHRPFTFRLGNQRASMNQIRGLSALLMNAAHMHHKFLSLSRVEIQMLDSAEDINLKHTIEAEVWQIVDKRDKVRVLFFFRKGNPALEPLQLDRAKRDRQELARLVRVDVRAIEGEDSAGGTASYIIDQATVDNEDALLAQYNIYNFAFDPSNDKAKRWMKKHPTQMGKNVQASNTADYPQWIGRERDLIETSESNFEELYDEHDELDDSKLDDSEQPGESMAEADYEQLMGLETVDTPLPDFIETLGQDTRYKMLTRLELLDGGSKKSILLAETMDLLTEKLLLEIYLSHKDLSYEKAVDKFLIIYDSELIFLITKKDKECRLIDDISNKWLRLFSAHLNYYTADESDGGNLVVKSNRLSSYGLGALWRRASQSGQTEFLGTRRERIERDGIKYKQLEWQLEEFDMSMRWTFLLEDDSSDQEADSDGAPMPQLESVLISNKYSGQDNIITSYRQVKATLVKFTAQTSPLDVMPAVCHDELEKARKQIQHDQMIKPPSVETVLGQTKQYKIDYTVYKSKLSASGDRQEQLWDLPESSFSSSNSIEFSESLDSGSNRGKIEVSGRDSGTELEFYIDGQSKRVFLMNKQSTRKCRFLSEFGETFNSIFGTKITDNPDFNSGQAPFGLMHLWQTLSQIDAKLHVNKFYDRTGAVNEDQTYIVERDHEADESKGYEEIRMYFEKRPPAGTFKRPIDNFNHSTKMRVRQEHNIELKRIELRQIGGQLQQQLQDDENELVRISIDRLEDKQTEEWKLPEECQKLVADPASDGSSSSSPSTPDPPAKMDAELPKLSRLLAQSNHFHMRSQVVVDGKIDSMYLVDELYNAGNVRIRTHRADKSSGKDCDLLLFADTQDQYDLSVPLKCAQLFGTTKSRCLNPSMNTIWLGGRFRIETLASLHYAPLYLWKLAEKSESEGISVKLATKIDLSGVLWTSTEDVSLETFKKQLEHEMDREVWFVRGIIDGKPTDWSYEMQFVKQERMVELEDGRQGVEEWHVLESITATDIIDADTLSVSIEVINYNEKPDVDTFNELFRLPEGWSCRRNVVGDSTRPYKLNLDLNYDVHLGYEASLELSNGAEEVVYDDDQLGFSRVQPSESRDGQLPTLVGSYSTGDNLIADDLPDSDESGQIVSKTLGLSVHQSVTRYQKGTSRFHRIIADRERSLEYDLDLMSGACSINTAQNPNWRLSFPKNSDENGTHTINLISFGAGPPGESLSDRNLFKLLFLDTENEFDQNLFYLVNQHVSDNNGVKILHSIYEGELESLRLSSDLQGPARVVRRYEQALENSNDQLKPTVANDYELVDFMTVQVYLLSMDKLEFRAIFTMRLRVNQATSLSEFLDLASVTECNNDAESRVERRQASFTLEYPLEGQLTAAFGHSMESVLRENFYANLLRSSGTKLSPLQLDGRAHLEFVEHDRLLRIHFDVLEAPSALVYFRRRFVCTMNERIEANSESRLLPNLAACSRWCDQINCLAMSYCDDRLCKVVTQVGVFGPRHTAKRKSKEERSADLAALADCKTSLECTYYYNKLGVRPRTLASFRDYLDRVVNKRSGESQLKALGLPLNSMGYDIPLIQNRVEPARFYESGDSFRWQHEDFDDPFQAELSGSGDISASSSSLFGMAGDGAHVMASNFAPWRGQSRFLANKVGTLNEKLDLRQDSKFTIMSVAAQNRAGCLQECERNDCLLVTTCKQQKHCELLSATGNKSIMSLGALKSELVDSDSPQCSISIHDHLDKFHMFENSRKPAKYWHKLEDYTAQECAAACHLNQADCLAFDLCTFSDVNIERQQARSVCFLQRDHVTQDSFDRSVLLPSWDIDRHNQNTIDGRQVDCDHYSKSLLAEFRRVPNAKVKELHGSILRGISVDRCAVDCLRDDACLAFEHCQNPNRQPTQSCYLIRANSDNDTDWLQVNLDEKKLEKNDLDSEAEVKSNESRIKEMREHIILSRSCSIYVANDVLKRERIEQTLTTTDDNEPTSVSSSHSTMVICICLLIAMVLGALLQLAYISRTGRPLSLPRPIG